MKRLLGIFFYPVAVACLGMAFLGLILYAVAEEACEYMRGRDN